MAKYVIIKKENEEKIMKAFKKVQGRATTRTIDYWHQLCKIIFAIDARIGNVTNKAKNGTVVKYNFQQHFPSAYKYSPDSTNFTLMFDKGNWRIDIESIKRDTCPNTSKRYEYDLILSDSAKAEILNRYE